MWIEYFYFYLVVLYVAFSHAAMILDYLFFSVQVPMFRSRQAEKSIDCPIFSEANLKQINAGIVPAESDLCFLNCCSHSKL